MRSDTELVLAVATGDVPAFGEIVARYQSLVCAIAFSGTGDFARAEEVAQETFLAAHQGLGSLRDPARLKAWLAGIARNLAQNARRRGARGRTEPLQGAPEPPTADPSPLDELLERERQALVGRALEEIPENYREALVLFYREEQSVARVAESLDLSEDAVKQRLSRGRQMLKAQVSELVETALARTRPGKAFTIAVLAALPASATKAAAAGVVGASAAKGSAAATGASALSLAGAVVGPLLGAAGAWVGARASIENTRSARERAFMVRMAWTSAAVSLAFVVVLGLSLVLLPRLFGNLTVQLGLAGLYAGMLAAFIARSNRRQRQIQIEDGTFVDPRALETAEPGLSRGAIQGSLAGGIFGSLCWMPIMAMVVGDYALGLAIIVFAAALYLVSVRAALRSPQAFFRISMAETAAVMAVTFAVVNWRWERWMEAYRRTRFYEPLSDLPLWAMNVLLVALFAWVFLRLTVAGRRRSPPVA